jgi:predicted nucleotide-binding protein (sugar kinase/HSP70/actin superfamily)
MRPDSKAIGVKQEWLEKCAKEYAEQAVQSFVAKLTKKLGALTDVQVLWANGDRFTIVGKLGDRDVKVHQDRVFKVSTQGTPFHQWPARIYLDGKFTPEAAFKKVAA